MAVPLKTTMRTALQDRVKDACKDIPDQASELRVTTVTSALNFGLGPAPALLSGTVDEILKDVPEAVGLVFRTIARLVAEAIRKLWTAFGKQAQDEIQKEAQGWFKKIWNDRSMVTGLLLELYDIKEIEDELATAIASLTICLP